MSPEPVLDVLRIFTGGPMSVMDYRPLGHERDEFPHVQRQNIRGANRRANRRKTARVVKRREQRNALRDMREQLN
jgi:hypothetical protein